MDRPQDILLLLQTGFVEKVSNSDVDVQADFLPVLPCFTKLHRLRAFPTVRLGEPNCRYPVSTKYKMTSAGETSLIDS